jgi:hypothetical protein
LSTPEKQRVASRRFGWQSIARDYAQVGHALLNASGMQAKDIQALGADGPKPRAIARLEF